MSEHGLSFFYFAVPRGASLASRQGVRMHIAREFGVTGPVEHVRSEGWFHLYRIEVPA